MKFKDILTALEQNQDNPEVPWLRIFLNNSEYAGLRSTILEIKGALLAFSGEKEINSFPELLASFEMNVDEFSIQLHLSQANSLEDLINTLGLQDYVIAEEIGANVKFNFFLSLNEQKQWCISTNYGELVVQVPHSQTLGSFSLFADDSEEDYDDEENCLALFNATQAGSFFSLTPKGIEFIQEYRDNLAEENETSELILFPIAQEEKDKIRGFLRDLEVPQEYIADDIDEEEEMITIKFPNEGLPCKLGMLSFGETENSQQKVCSTIFLSPNQNPEEKIFIMDCVHSQENISNWNIGHVFFITPRFEALLKGESYNKKILSWSEVLHRVNHFTVNDGMMEEELIETEEQEEEDEEQELVETFRGTNGVSLSVGNMHSVKGGRSATPMITHSNEEMEKEENEAENTYTYH